MKKFLLLVIMCAVGLLNTYAQTPITIGDGSTESQIVPLMADYEYNLSQQIYLQEEIGIDAGTISSIAFYASSNFTKNISVYMVNTDKSSFTSSNGDFIALPEGSLLYDGEVSFKMGDWTTIEFQTPFSYTGSNLMLCVYDHTGEYIPVAPSFKAYSATDGVQRTAGVYSYGALLEEFVNGGTLESERPEKFWDFSECYDPETVAITRSQIKLSVTTNEGGSEGGEEPTPGDDPETPDTAQTITIGGDGAGSSAQLPTNMFYSYSLTQQIYTGAEMNYTVGDVTKVAFYQAAEVPAAYSPMTRDIVVYMLNTEKEYFSTMTDWVPVTGADIVYEGTFTTSEMNTWVEIELQTPFAYAGGNFVLCIHDVTGGYANEAYFKTYEVVPEVENTGRTLGNYRDGGAYNINDLASEYGNVSTQLNSVQLTINSEPGLSVNPKDGINFGTIQLGNYWPEKAEASVKVTVGAIDRTVASITTDNDFFVLPEIDMTATPITFNVGYNKEAAAGTYNGTLTVTAEEGDVVEVPMTAVVYNPVEPDVFELAREISFTENAYSDTPDFTTLHDDYVLPSEGENGLAPDAVYSFTLEGQKIIKAEVEGEGGFYAIYRADSIGEGKGPQANNNYKGEETILSTAFEYDFADNSAVNDFSVQDLDEYTDFCWGIENGQLVSYSFYGWYDEDGNWVYINKADERIITNDAYTITPNTVLTFDMQRENSSSYQNVTVEITKDGQEFTSIRTVEVHPDYWDDYKEYYPEDFDENGNYITLRRINLGEEFIAACLEYGDYRISLRANNNGAGTLIIDNLALTERAGVYEAGDYYMVAAAKEAFSVEMVLEDYNGSGEEPEGIAAPTNLVATALSDVQIELSWDAVEGAVEYGVYIEGEYIGPTTYLGAVVNGFEANTTFCFTVTAFDAEGNESAHSNEACATTLDAPSDVPATPTNLAIEVLSDTELRLTWDAVDGATSYNIYAYGQLLGDVINNAVKLIDLDPTMEYCFTVSAVNSVGESDESDEECALDVEELTTTFNIYPNPVNDVLFIENGNNIEEVSIYTITGVMVYNEQCVSNNVQVNVSELEGGIYIIKVRTENNEVINRFVKK